MSAIWMMFFAFLFGYATYDVDSSEYDLMEDDYYSDTMNDQTYDAEQDILKALSISQDINAPIGEYGSSLLHMALEIETSLDTIKKLLAAGADLEMKDDDGFTSLITALFFEQPDEIIHYLVESGSDVNVVDYFDATPLAYAMYYPNRIELAQYLMSKGANLNAGPGGSVRVFLHASENNIDRELLDFFMENGMGINDVDHEGYTPLITLCASSKIDFDLVKFMVEQGADVTKINDFKESALTWAVIRKDAEVAKYLMDNGADANILDTDSASLISLAFQVNADDALIFELIRRTNHINTPETDGYTPILYALESDKDVEFLKAMVAAGADLRVIDSYGDNLLHTALLLPSSIEVVEYLLESGLDANARDYENYSPLDLTVYEGFYEITPEYVKLLLKYNAQVNAVDSEGNSVLFYALSSKNPDEVIHILLDAGADVNIGMQYGYTSLMTALDMGYPMEIIKKMVDAGADLNPATSLDFTVYDLAGNYDDNGAMLEYLKEVGAKPLDVKEKNQSEEFVKGVAQ